MRTLPSDVLKQLQLKWKERVSSDVLFFTCSLQLIITLQLRFPTEAL